ncbi:MAG: hypothetical protein ISS79_02250 [Phycisphaerae bacterium]|nr:hypothetical protein [Phycisphaerae bacterium]
MSTAVTAVLVLVIGILFLTGNRAWQRSYAAANSRIKQDATGISLAFGSIGRRSSRLDYVLYNTTGDTLRPALPKTTNPEEVVWGDAIEFRYWDVPLDESDSHNLLDVTKTGTAYALFYLDDTQLKVDYGPYPPGAAPKGGGPRNTAGVTTQVLAENVSTENEGGAFSHTTLNGIGQGSVRIDVILTDPGGDEVINLTTATLLRSIWPR